ASARGARAGRGAAWSGHPLASRRAQREAQLPDPRRRAAENPVHGRGGAARGRGGLGRGAGTGRGKEASGAGGGRIRGEVATGGSHPLTDTVSLSVIPRA